MERSESIWNSNGYVDERVKTMRNANKPEGHILNSFLESLGIDGVADLQETIGQLKSLEDHCRSMIDEKDPVCIWREDCDAIKIAIKALEMIKAIG